MRWFAMSTRFLQDPKVEQLGEKHGPAGPLLWVALLTLAGQQEEGGRVEVSFRTLAHQTFIDPEVIDRILETFEKSQLCHGLSRDVTGVTLTVSEWNRWQQNYRKAKSRAKAETDDIPHEQADVTPGHKESRDVTTRQEKTGQEITEEEGLTTPFPTDLLPYLKILQGVAVAKKAPSVKPRLVLKACEDFADRDLAAETREFEHWWVHGKGSPKRLKDVVGAWRRWLRNSEPRKTHTKSHLEVVVDA